VSDYAATAARAAATLDRKGAAVSFTAEKVGRVYDEDTGLWTEGADVTDNGFAVELPDQMERYQRLGLSLNDPVTLVVSKLSALTPAPGMKMAWAGRTYTVRPPVDHVAPDGGPIISTVIGDR
jgi:hypothetical protein